MSALTVALIEEAFRSVESRGWPSVDSGPWIDAMDLALRTYELRHQFAIVGYGLGRGGPGEILRRPGWITLLERVNTRAEPIQLPSTDRIPRPASVIPGGGGFRRRRRTR